eukprot:COSAG01_NODE_14329_length_1467_cov_6.167398_2_plen_74_part_00
MTWRPALGTPSRPRATPVMSEPETHRLYKRALECPDKELKLVGESAPPPPVCAGAQWGRGWGRGLTAVLGVHQ